MGAALEHMDVPVRRSGVPVAPGAQIGLRRRNESFAGPTAKAPLTRGFFLLVVPSNLDVSANSFVILAKAGILQQLKLCFLQAKLIQVGICSW